MSVEKSWLSWLMVKTVRSEWVWRSSSRKWTSWSSKGVE